MSKDLNEVLNYMKRYVENKYEHDSEPMLNYKDLQLVLEEIERLKEELKYTVPVVEYNKTITKHIKEKEQLHSIIKEVRERVLNENKPLPSVREIIEILDKVGSVKE